MDETMKEIRAAVEKYSRKGVADFVRAFNDYAVIAMVVDYEKNLSGTLHDWEYQILIREIDTRGVDAINKLDAARVADTDWLAAHR